MYTFLPLGGVLFWGGVGCCCCCSSGGKEGRRRRTTTTWGGRKREEEWRKHAHTCSGRAKKGGRRLPAATRAARQPEVGQAGGLMGGVATASAARSDQERERARAVSCRQFCHFAAALPSLFPAHARGSGASVQERTGGWLCCFFAKSAGGQRGGLLMRGREEHEQGCAQTHTEQQAC